MSAAASNPKSRPGAVFERRLHRIYGGFTVGFIVFVVGLGLLEHLGLPDNWIGLIFLVATVLLFAFIGIFSRTTNAVEYYVAGRRVPALFNGMATGADWMSTASFIGLAGTLYLQGFSGSASDPGGLAFVLGWTGGYCLVALLLAPYLRSFGQYTIPDFLGQRFGGSLPRLIGAFAAILCSFTYVVAQIYGVGLITTHLTGVAFELGIFLGLGAILLCSFLGGMRAVTWTQVSQYIIIILAYLIPVVWLSVKQTGVPIPQLVYGTQMQKVSAREKELLADPKEQAVIAAFAARASETQRKLADVPAALAAESARAERALADLKAGNAPPAQIQTAEKVLRRLPHSPEAARAVDEIAGADLARCRSPACRSCQALRRRPAAPAERRMFDDSRRNFLALVFCLMVGTAALPHILMRYYTTPSVREARESVAWSLLFITVLYVTAPACVLAGRPSTSPRHALQPAARMDRHWSHAEPALLSVVDINRDGILQLGEISIASDIVVLATPAIGGLPYVVTALVATGALAAALSTADGLLLTIGYALSHDIYYKMIDPNASASRRVLTSKMLLLVVALAAASVAAQRPGNILLLVSAAFSLAAAAFFPALVLGVFWKRANKWGAVCGMVSGLALTCYYMATTHPWLREVLGVRSPLEPWWGIQPISAGVFGVPLGFAVIVIVSLLTPAPNAAQLDLAERVRYPGPLPLPPRPIADRTGSAFGL
jgi:cation/acetate symporter